LFVFVWPNSEFVWYQLTPENWFLLGAGETCVSKGCIIFSPFPFKIQFLIFLIHVFEFFFQYTIIIDQTITIHYQDTHGVVEVIKICSHMYSCRYNCQLFTYASKLLFNKYYYWSILIKNKSNNNWH